MPLFAIALLKASVLINCMKNMLNNVHFVLVLLISKRNYKSMSVFENYWTPKEHLFEIIETIFESFLQSNNNYAYKPLMYICSWFKNMFHILYSNGLHIIIIKSIMEINKSKRIYWHCVSQLLLFGSNLNSN